MFFKLVAVLEEAQHSSSKNHEEAVYTVSTWRLHSNWLSCMGDSRASLTLVSGKSALQVVCQFQDKLVML